MTTVSAELSVPIAKVLDKPSHAVRILQVYSIALMILPADYVVTVIGADGYAAALVSYAMLAMWFAGSLLGQHNPFACRYPVRVTLAGMWAVTIASYLMMSRASLSTTQLLAADRWLMQLAGMSGVILVAAEGVRTLEDVRRVLRTLTWGGAFCGIVALLQFKARVNLANYLKLPGFSENSVTSGTAMIVSRGGLNRVFGTALDPIELGVSAGMMLTLAAYLMMHDTGRAKWRRVLPVVCIAMAVAVSVSRSGVISVLAALGVLVVSLPPIRRLKGLTTIPLTLLVIFLAIPGLISTLASFFLAGNADPSVSHRTNNYPYVEQLVHEHPLLGQGGGTYISDELHVLDNQYLSTAIELGLLGLAALVFYLAWPVAVALVARQRTNNPELKDLFAALAGAELATVLCAATFDAFSFPMFFNLQALIAGLIGAAWMIAKNERDGISTYRTSLTKESNS
jgi:O-antigen ligase